MSISLLLFNGTSILDILAARPAAMIKTKAFSICSTRPEHPAVKDCLSQVKVTIATAEVALDRVIWQEQEWMWWKKKDWWVTVDQKEWQYIEWKTNKTLKNKRRMRLILSEKKWQLIDTYLKDRVVENG